MNSEQLPAALLTTAQGEAIPLERVSITGVLRGFAAEVVVAQHYRNAGSRNVEAVYTFPLPMAAVLLEVQLEIGERRLHGQIVEKKAAEECYEEAVTSGDSALMIELSGPGLYTLNFGNLLAGETAVIRYRYVSLLHWQGACVRFVLPTTLAPRYGDPARAGLAVHQIPEHSLTASYPLSLSLDIEGALAEGELSCPSHTVHMTRMKEGCGVHIRLLETATLDRDFVLSIQGAQDSASCLFRQPGGEQVVLASLRIPPLAREEEKPLLLKVVIDCSGSMAGISIAQARAAALELLDQLRRDDFFNVTLFGSEAQHFWPEPVSASKEHLAQARQQLVQLNADMGGTETGAALAEVYAQGQRQRHDESVAQVLLITDGQVWDYQAIIDRARSSHHRVFTVGVGLSSVEGFLVELARQTRGAHVSVQPQEGMRERILSQFHRMRQPRMRLDDLSLGRAVAWSTALPESVFAGDTVHVFAGLAGEAEAPGSVSLNLAGAARTAQRVEVPVVETDWAELPRMAAAARLEEMLEDEGSTAETLQLALTYQLLTEQTNYLVVVERDEKAQNLPELARVPQMMAAGWGGLGANMREISACLIPDIHDNAASSPTAASEPRISACPPLASRASAYGGTGSTIRAHIVSTCEYDCFPPFDDFCLDPATFAMKTPREFMAALMDDLPDHHDPEHLPETLEALAAYGLPDEVLALLQQLVNEYEGEHDVERIVVAVFLMALRSVESLSAPWPRQFSRLILTRWKRTVAGRYEILGQEILDRVTAWMTSLTADEWNMDEGAA